MFTHRRDGMSDHQHETVAQARDCEYWTAQGDLALEQEFKSWAVYIDPQEVISIPDPNACSGGKCTDIYSLCSKHQMRYQTKYGVASNE